MAKGVNPMLAKLQAKHEQELNFFRTFTIQQCIDMAMIALNDKFGFGAERLNQFEDTFYEVFKEYAQSTIEDAKTDKDINWTKGVMDRKLKQIMGEHFVPWEERYG